MHAEDCANVYVNTTSNLLFKINNNDLKFVQSKVANHLKVSRQAFYLLQNGKVLDNEIRLNRDIYVVPRVLGGKGGFGSMLRAIGAQIEKTTNREACRDLSGRRLRDINEEKRLKTWITQQAEREKDAEERKLKKLERLCEKPKHEFKDESYDKERSVLPERIEDAVMQGIEASMSNRKRKNEDVKTKNKKKPKLWLDAELEDEFSSSAEECDKNDSGNSSSNLAAENSTQPIEESADVGLHTTELQKT